MSEQLKKNREARGKLIADMRGILSKAEQEERSVTADEDKEYQRMETDYDKLEKDGERLERAIEREAAANESNGNEHREEPNSENHNTPEADEEKRSGIFDQFLRNGAASLSMEQREMIAGSDVDGGYLVVPQKMVSGLLKEIDLQVHIRGMATKHSLKKAASLGVVTLDNDIDDWDWTTELATGEEDDGLQFGKREMRPHPIAKRVKISNTLIRLSSVGVQQLVTGRMAYKLGTTMENAYMLGDGSQKPLGLFVNSDNGIPAARDVATNMTTTAITGDGLIDVQGSIRDGYQGKCKWLFHRDAITQIRKLKSSDNQYLWQPGLAEGTKNKILGKTYTVSEFCPNTFTTGQYVGMYGDFSYYWILDSLMMQMQVLKELYAETNQIGYIGRYEGDGQPVLAEAFSRIKLA